MCGFLADDAEMARVDTLPDEQVRSLVAGLLLKGGHLDALELCVAALRQTTEALGNVERSPGLLVGERAALRVAEQALAALAGPPASHTLGEHLAPSLPRATATEAAP